MAALDSLHSVKMVASFAMSMSLILLFLSSSGSAQPDCANLEVITTWEPYGSGAYYEITVTVRNTCLLGPLWCTLSNIKLASNRRYSGAQFLGDIKQNYKNKDEFIVKNGEPLGPGEEVHGVYYWILPALEFTVSRKEKSCNGV